MPRGVYPRKKSKTMKTVTKKVTEKKEAPVNEEIAPLQLDQLSLLKLAKLDAEMRASHSDVLIQKGVKEGILQKVDPHGVLKQLDAKIQQLTVKAHAATASYNSFREELGKRLGIDMKNFAYDDETGVLHDISEEAANAPATAPVGVVPPQETLPTQKQVSVQ